MNRRWRTFFARKLDRYGLPLSRRSSTPTAIQSDEVDVSVINENQPIRTGGHEQLLIAEDVDAVYQVKARLNADELRRSIKNAQSVKQLFLPLGDGSWARATDSDGPRFIDRIPFFVFGYESRIAAETAVKLLNEELAGSPWDQQPDGVFVLDDWSAVNVGDNRGTFKVGPAGTTGFSLVAGMSSLAMMLWCHHLFVHRIVHFTHPLRRYHPFTRLGSS